MMGFLWGSHLRLAGPGLMALALSACATMGSEGHTRAVTARVLGLDPGDVIIVSRSYNETGPGVADIALANYTVQTSAGFTYICDPGIQSKTTATDVPVCVRKPKH